MQTFKVLLILFQACFLIWSLTSVFFVTTAGLAFWWSIAIRFHFKFRVCLDFSHTAQPQVLEAQYVSAQPYDAFSWTMNQKRQCYALISILKGKKTPNTPLKCKNKRNLVRSLCCLLSSLKSRTQKSFDTFAIPCALPLDHKGSVGDDMVPPQLGAVLSGQLRCLSLHSQIQYISICLILTGSQK